MGPSFTGSIHEIDADISQFRLRLSVLPRDHPLPIGVSMLGMQLLARYGQSNQKDDLDKSILHFTESLLFSPLSWLAHGPVILDVLYLIALSLSERSRVSKEPEVLFTQLNISAICETWHIPRSSRASKSPQRLWKRWNCRWS